MPRIANIAFKSRLVVSCQDHEEVMIPAAYQGGAGGLRVNTPEKVMMAKKLAPGLPIIACWKRQQRNGDIYVTPTLSDAIALAEAGADMVAFDARRSRKKIGQFVWAIESHGAKPVADIDCGDSAKIAIEADCDVVATTFAPKLDYGLIRALSEEAWVIAEGNVATPDEAATCANYGANLVVVGTAITRPLVMTARFVQAMEVDYAAVTGG